MVFVLDQQKRPLAPCHPARARKLLRQGKASIYKHYPFTVILHYDVSISDATTPEAQKQTGEGDADKSAIMRPKEPSQTGGEKKYYETVLKLDPGSRYTGLAIIRGNRVLYMMQINHKTGIKNSMLERAAYRRNRRGRKTRYRKARFLNRKRKKEFLVPTLRSRMQHVVTWVRRIMRLCHIDRIEYELVRFDVHLLMNPDIKGKEYQEGPLFESEMRSWLINHYSHTCQYCGATDGPMEWEHIHPKSRGGSNSLKNATLACHACNSEKDNMKLDEWAAKIQSHRKKTALDKKRLEGIQKVKEQNPAVFLADAAIVNANRWRLKKELEEATGLKVKCSGTRYTATNRKKLGLAKDHCLDAVCVGGSTPKKIRFCTNVCHIATAKGRGQHNCTLLNKYGFPRIQLAKQKIMFGFKTGDAGKAVAQTGKYQGTYYGRITCRQSGAFAIDCGDKKCPSISYKKIRLLQMADGYHYSQKTIWPWKEA